MANPILNDIRLKIKSGNPVTRLIIINVAVFLFFSLLTILSFLTGKSPTAVSLQLFLRDNLTLPLNFNDWLFKPWTLVTYMFTHLDFMHIFWNMISLFWFGQILSEYTSERKIIPLYILGGIAGAIITMLLIGLIPALSQYSGYLLGASAGVTAIIVAAATLVPEVRLNLMFIGPVKLIYIALFVIFISVLNMASYDNIGGNLAHLGGALMGFVFIYQYKKGRDLARPLNRFFDWLKGLFKAGNKSQMKVVHKRKLSDEEYNYNKIVTQKQVDAILDKISKSGYESLSKTEKDILFKASMKK